MKEEHPVGAVVTTYKRGLEYLPGVLASLERQSARAGEVTVAVDGADAATIAYLEREWPAVRVVSTPEPRGFAGIAQLGIEATRGRHVAIMNDDIELERDWLERLVGELDQDPGLGFATGKTLLYDQRDLINETTQVAYTCGRFEPRGLLEKDVGQFDRPEGTTIASASASVYRRDAIEAAGGFDPDYFLYCEDADLCLRMILSGYRGLYIPEARAYHAWAASTGRTSSAARYYGVRNSLTTLVKDFPATVLLTSLPKIVLYQVHVLNLARAERSVPLLRRAWADFLRQLPATLRKRRALMRGRRIGAREFRAFVNAAYPVPTGLTPRQLGRWFKHRVAGPLLRVGGSALELVPSRVRPRIRTRDRSSPR